MSDASNEQMDSARARALKEGDRVVVLVECTGSDPEGEERTHDAGSAAIVTDVRVLPDPQGLTVTVSVGDDPDTAVIAVFDETDGGWPLRRTPSTCALSTEVEAALGQVRTAVLSGRPGEAKAALDGLEALLLATPVAEISLRVEGGMVQDVFRANATPFVLHVHDHDVDDELTSVVVSPDGRIENAVVSTHRDEDCDLITDRLHWSSLRDPQDTDDDGDDDDDEHDLDEDELDPHGDQPE